MMNTQEATYQEKIRLQQENARTETEVQRQRYAQVQEEQKRQTLQVCTVSMRGVGHRGGGSCVPALLSVPLGRRSKTWL